MTFRSALSTWTWGGVLVVSVTTSGCGDLKIGSHGAGGAGSGGNAGAAAGRSGSLGTGGTSAAGAGAGGCAVTDGGPVSRHVVSIAVGDSHNCVLLSDGSVRCWGDNVEGALGLGSLEPVFVGDDEKPETLPDVDIGGRATQVAVGQSMSCVVFDDGAVRCWGWTYSSLGYFGPVAIGDDEVPSEFGLVEIGGNVKQIATSGAHTCAVLDNGAVRCWGTSLAGQLGYQLGRYSEELIGDDETPASAGDVDVGGPVQKVVTGDLHTCALLTNGAVRCWGEGDVGRLGYANTNDIGDDEAPASVGDVDLGGRAIDLAAGGAATCAILEGGGVRCWGSVPPQYYPDVNVIGDDETPAIAPLVELGAPAEKISMANGHICALLESHAVRCWGFGLYGVLGYGNTKDIYGNTNDIGDDETPADAGDLHLGGRVREVVTSLVHFCAVLENYDVRCWGGAVPAPPGVMNSRTSALLGQGDNTQVIGDDEFPDIYLPVDVQ